MQHGVSLGQLSMNEHDFTTIRDSDGAQQQVMMHGSGSGNLHSDEQRDIILR